MGLSAEVGMAYFWAASTILYIYTVYKSIPPAVVKKCKKKKVNKNCPNSDCMLLISFSGHRYTITTNLSNNTTTTTTSPSHHYHFILHVPSTLNWRLHLLNTGSTFAVTLMVNTEGLVQQILYMFYVSIQFISTLPFISNKHCIIIIIISKEKFCT